MYPNIYAPEQRESLDAEYRRVAAMIDHRNEDYLAFHRFLELSGIEWRPGLYAAWCGAHREVVS